MQIGQLSKATQCSIETIRYYEKIGLLPKPTRSVGNFRQYTPEHLSRLSFIRYCRSLDISLSEIKTLLTLKQDVTTADKLDSEISALLNRHLQAVTQRIHELEHLRFELMKLKGNSHLLHYMPQGMQHEQLGRLALTPITNVTDDGSLSVIDKKSG